MSWSSEAVAYWTLEQIRWPTGPTCPRCDSPTVYYLRPSGGHRTTSTGATTHRRIWKCGRCRRQFSVLTGTPLEGTRVPVSAWLAAIYLLDSGAEVSVGRLHRLGVTYKTAHRMRWLLATSHLRAFVAPSSTAHEHCRMQRGSDAFRHAIRSDRYPGWEPGGRMQEWADPTGDAALE